MFKKYHQIHFVGIGGIGMSGIAEVLLNLGYGVTGSDLKLGEITKRLASKGAKIFKGHARKNVAGANVVVVSSAVSDSNPEVREAKKLGVPVVPRAEMLAELMRLKYAVAVAGTHGKTSTTSLLGGILDRAGLDPTLIIGGKVNNLRSNAKLGKGEYLVAEADESDRSFLKLDPTIAVITNIDPEHMENYRDFDDLKNAFIQFASRVPFYGAVVACSEHPVVRSILKKIDRPIITYGTKNADYCARKITQVGDNLKFTVVHKGKKMGDVRLNMSGMHYVQNALGAIAGARHLDIPFSIIKDALADFGGVSRRFEILSRKGPIVVDDYAHHPVEIEATLKAAKLGWPGNRIVAVMQPHRFTRLALHFDAFVKSLGNAHEIILMDVYPAGERPGKKYTGEKLWREVCRRYPAKKVSFARTGADVMMLLPSRIKKEDLVIFLGAGSITQTARTFAKMLTF